MMLAFIRPGRPVENGFIESFNGRLRDEFLNVDLLFSLADAQGRLARWRKDFNGARPHSPLPDRTPSEFAALWKDKRSAVVESASPRKRSIPLVESRLRGSLRRLPPPLTQPPTTRNNNLYQGAAPTRIVPETIAT